MVATVAAKNLAQRLGRLKARWTAHLPECLTMQHRERWFHDAGCLPACLRTEQQET